MIDLTGERFGRLVVISETERIRNKNGIPYRMWICKCDCGNTLVCDTNRLRQGITKSCGCLRREIARKRSISHGKSKTKLYHVWTSMKGRCFRESDNAYKNYGKRGIGMCEEWINDFNAFHEWAITNGYKEGLTIERIDNDSGYFPDNCKWIPRKEQSRNRRSCHYITYHGETKTLSEWSRLLHIDRECVRNREAELGDGSLAIEAVLNSPKHLNKLKVMEG